MSPESLYAGRMVEDKHGDWWFMAFLGGAEEAVDGQFDDEQCSVGGLTDPFPVIVTTPAELRVDLTAGCSRGKARGLHHRALRAPLRRTTLSLAPEIRTLIARFDALGAAISPLPLGEQRVAIQAELDGAVPGRAPAGDGPPSASQHIANHRIPVAGGEITARVFTPPPLGRLPGLVHFHGGGFTLGTVDSFFSDVRCAHISAEAGCVLVTVDYRLAPEHTFPTAFEDCYAGLAWVSAHVG